MRRRSRAGVATVVLAMGICLASGGAVAEGRYLRGGIGLERPRGAVFTDTDCAGTVPAALYGCSTGGDGARSRFEEKTLALFRSGSRPP